jgi:hypothetical protein
MKRNTIRQAEGSAWKCALSGAIAKEAKCKTFQNGLFGF